VSSILAAFWLQLFTAVSNGGSVVNRAQWDSEEDWMLMVRARAAQFRQKNPFGWADPHLYQTETIYAGNRA
jgi:hypothetical protein